jgi:hypothetical protein
VEVRALRQQIVGRYAEGSLPGPLASDARYWIQMLRGLEIYANQVI